ncbi:unnamed protein product [Chrysoparadoxa australica]
MASISTQFLARLAASRGGEVRLKLGSKVALLEICNNARANAFTGAMMLELRAALSKLEQWDGVGLVVCGQPGGAGSGDGGGDIGHNFCAGMDLSLARDHLLTEEGDGKLMSRLMSDTLTRLGRLPLISIACIEGAAVGGGAELATACDFRVLSRSAKLQFKHVQMGLTPGWGGLNRLMRITGRREALRLLAWSEPLNAQEALTRGLGDELCADGTAEQHARALLELLPSNSQAIRTTKDAIATLDDMDSARAEAEHASFCSLWGGPENLRAFSPPEKPPSS